MSTPFLARRARRATQAERQLFSGWNTSKALVPAGASLVQMVSEWAVTTPTAVALTADAEAVTYAELNARADELAECLRTAGVHTECVVGVFLGRSIDQIVSALGILKAGGAYLPLDPEQPDDRVAYMINDARVDLVISRGTLTERVADLGVRTVDLATDDHRIADAGSAAAGGKVSTDDLAYVIYTSGSTGRPKGVAVNHGSLLNLVFWHRQAFDICPADRGTLIASPGFDAAVWEVWPYLTAGASVHVVDDSVRTTPEQLRDWMLARDITISFLPTALAECVMNLEWPEKTVLHTLLTGGDVLRHYPPARLPFTVVNNYGPTEGTVVVTSGRVLPESAVESLPPIGRAIANVEVYILDEDQEPVAIGERGELFIGGAGLARGYLHQPKLTAATFIAHPFSTVPGSRLYRTGDLARYRADGQIEFLGRSDDQIKIRGFRIEPQEIVSVLNRHTAVQNSLVIAREDTVGSKRLVAYIERRADVPVTDDDLRGFVQQYLPNYMAPDTFVGVEAFPLTANGKIDRESLPEPTAANRLSELPATAATSPVEQRVADILAALLKVQSVGVTDNFFLLGGHSLLGTQLLARVHDAFGVAPSLHALFEAPTVVGLSAAIDRLILAKVVAMDDEMASRLAQ